MMARPDGVELVDLTEDAGRLFNLLKSVAVDGTMGRDPDEYDIEETRAAIRKSAVEGLALGACIGRELVGAMSRPKNVSAGLQSL